MDIFHNFRILHPTGFLIHYLSFSNLSVSDTSLTRTLTNSMVTRISFTYWGWVSEPYPMISNFPIDNIPFSDPMPVSVGRLSVPLIYIF